MKKSKAYRMAAVLGITPFKAAALIEAPEPADNVGPIRIRIATELLLVDHPELKQQPGRLRQLMRRRIENIRKQRR